MTDSRPAPLFLIGAPAVGKMTVGREIAELTGLRLFHNHLSIDPVLRFFDFGSPSFTELRLAEKPSKRDVVRSEQLLLEHERLYRFRTNGQFDHRSDWHRLDTSEMQPRQAAENIVRHFALGAISA